MYQGCGYIIHSAKGTAWKKHKYIRKEGNRYIYVENENKAGIREKINMFVNGNDLTESQLKRNIEEYNELSEFLENVSKSTLPRNDNSRKHILQQRDRLKWLDMRIATLNTALNAQRYLGETGLGRTAHGNPVKKK